MSNQNSPSLTTEQWEAWKRHPVTELVIAQLTEYRNKEQESLKDKALSAFLSPHTPLQESALTISSRSEYLQGLTALIDLDYEGVANEQ